MAAGAERVSLVNLKPLTPGTRLGLSSGATVVVTQKSSDGMWVFVRYVTSPRDATLVGREEMVFAQDVIEVLN